MQIQYKRWFCLCTNIFRVQINILIKYYIKDYVYFFYHLKYYIKNSYFWLNHTQYDIFRFVFKHK